MSYFYDYLKKIDKDIIIYIDMDGVVADYDAVGYLHDKEKKDVYYNKRPIKTTIDILKSISTLSNVKLNILSCTRKEEQIEGKKRWLKEYMNFIDEDNINIISREKKSFIKAKEIKREFLKNTNKDNTVTIVIDDSHEVIDEILRLNNGIIPLHITSILD